MQPEILHLKYDNVVGKPESVWQRSMVRDFLVLWLFLSIRCQSFDDFILNIIFRFYFDLTILFRCINITNSVLANDAISVMIFI